jgi:hypothetical protein
VSRALSALISLTLVSAVLLATPVATAASRPAGWGFIRFEHILEAHDLGIVKPGPLAWNAAANALEITDRVTGFGKLVTTRGAAHGNLSRAQAPHSRALSATDPSSGHRFTLDLRNGVLVEASATGQVLAQRNVAGFRLQGVEGIAVAPTSDITDPGTFSSLYVSVADASDGSSATGPGVLELALSAQAISPLVASAPDNVGHLIKSIDTTDSNWNPFSPDPSGIAYDNATGTLVMADGEIEEEQVNTYPYPGHNVWDVNPVTGAGTGIMDTTTASPNNNEPVGVAYDIDRNELYISRDGAKSRVWAYERIGSQWVERSSIDLAVFGLGDAEGLAFANNQLYVADGSDKDVWVIGAGNDGTVATGDDTVVRHFDTATMGITNPEGIGVDRNTGNLWILSHNGAEGMIETTPQGTLISTTHYDFATNNPGGLDIGPSSSTSDASNVMSAWIAQRGVDNNTDPSEKDGKIFEVAIQTGSPPPPPGDLVQNGDFESGSLGQSPPSWTTSPNFTTSNAVVHAGAFSGRHSSSADAGYKIEQTDAATPGTYNFDAWVNPVASTDTYRIVLKVQWRTASKAISTVTIAKVTKSTPPGVWNEFAQTLTAPAGTANVKVSMVVSSLNATVYVDDISLTAP